MPSTLFPAPTTDEGMRMMPGELIEEFYDAISDLNSQTVNPYVYLLPDPGSVIISRTLRQVSARVEYVTKDKLRKGADK